MFALQAEMLPKPDVSLVFGLQMVEMVSPFIIIILFYLLLLFLFYWVLK